MPESLLRSGIENRDRCSWRLAPPSADRPGGREGEKSTTIVNTHGQQWGGRCHYYSQSGVSSGCGITVAVQHIKALMLSARHGTPTTENIKA